MKISADAEMYLFFVVLLKILLINDKIIKKCNFFVVFVSIYVKGVVK